MKVQRYTGKAKLYERERNAAPKSNVLTSGFPVGPKSDRDYSVFITLFFSILHTP
jgi:hypothetical protein